MVSEGTLVGRLEFEAALDDSVIASEAAGAELDSGAQLVAAGVCGGIEIVSELSEGFVVSETVFSGFSAGGLDSAAVKGREDRE